jgi:O-acetyl-ADP-ribose deacetylase (regulator of RNase III)
MVEIVQGNLLEAPVEALVNSVNTVGVMGKGIALQFKRAFPDNFEAYAKACKRHEVRIGEVFVHQTGLLHPRLILNVPTKRHWKEPSRLDDVRRGIQALVATIRRLEITSVAVPPLGCGAGGLAWQVVRPLLAEAFAELPSVDVRLYAPGPAPEAKAMPNRTSRPKMTPGRASLLALASAYLDTGLDDTITTIELQKLAYFMQLAGERLQLRSTKHHYGPYADNLRKVLEIMEGHFISGLGDDAARPTAEVELLPGAREEAEAALQASPATKVHIDRVLELICGFEDAYGLELLATTHWIARHEAGTLDEVIARVRAWSSRKAMMKPEHLRTAWERLREHPWTGLDPATVASHP